MMEVVIAHRGILISVSFGESDAELTIIGKHLEPS